jgi:hypothetical protein
MESDVYLTGNPLLSHACLCFQSGLFHKIVHIQIWYAFFVSSMSCPRHVCLIMLTVLVGTALGNGLDDRGSRVRFPAGAGNFSHHRVQNGSGVHPASYPMGTRGSFPGGGGEAAWAGS